MHHDFVLTSEMLHGPVRTGRFKVRQETVPLSTIDLNRSSVHWFWGSWIMTDSGCEFTIDTNYHFRTRAKALLTAINRLKNQTEGAQP